MSTTERLVPRVLLDANVLISYLLRRGPSSAVVQLVEAAFEGACRLLLTHEIVAEVSAAVARKPYLGGRISAAQVDELVAALAVVAEVISTISDPIPAVTSDPRDDYLLAYALVGSADYLITGDEDLLCIGQVEATRIVGPASFLELLRTASHD